jgi:hypothetical protein
MSKKVLISLQEYQRLARRDVQLTQLECCGVDNWSGWGQYNYITEGDASQEIKDAEYACCNYIVEDK